YRAFAASPVTRTACSVVSAGSQVLPVGLPATAPYRTQESLAPAVRHLTTMPSGVCIWRYGPRVTAAGVPVASRGTGTRSDDVTSAVNAVAGGFHAASIRFAGMERLTIGPSAVIPSSRAARASRFLPAASYALARSR